MARRSSPSNGALARPAGGAAHLLLVTGAYPLSEGDYGGQPVQRRVAAYRAAGHEVTVVVPDGSDLTLTVAPDGTTVARAGILDIPRLARRVGATHLFVHSPTPELWVGCEQLSRELPTAVWIHGFEARDWRLLSFDFTAVDVARLGPRLDRICDERRHLLGRIFDRDDVLVVFVSDYMRSVAQDFVGAAPRRWSVIHNVIRPDLFPDPGPDPARRRRIVSVRNYARRNYATDLVTMALLEMARRPWFRDVEVVVAGAGRHFEEDTAPLRGLDNVDVREGFVGPAELSARLSWAGLALLPTRWDSQGMIMGEAMMSGAVPLVNAVAAIPEFVDPTCAVLAASDSIEEFVTGTEALLADPDAFVAMSVAAHARVLDQCGVERTVGREVALLEAPHWPPAPDRSGSPAPADSAVADA